MAGEYQWDSGAREDIAKCVDGVARTQGKERGDEETMTIEDQSHFELPEEFDVLLTVFLGEVLAFEDVGQD